MARTAVDQFARDPSSTVDLEQEEIVEGKENQRYDEERYNQA